ncbi:MAG TPA: hypothetical protein VK175_16805 [Leadbetterella sp.]|nr:hypothetical protein [Leadbetterella sp.]
MIIQSNLELLCNWIVFEKEKLLVYGDDIEKLSASNKIRLLLNHLNIPLIIPKSIDVSFKLNNEIVDGPSLLTNLRNAMVHPKLKNRGKLTTFSEGDKNEIKSMSIVYTELAILYMLGYQGQFFNRCGYFESKGESMFVPWNRSARIESQ